MEIKLFDFVVSKIDFAVSFGSVAVTVEFASMRT